ncbi:hypothetical protein [Jiulongibacter sp. NS-SX5]|uniref:hypothetical protein n=1 Tax=Jiulongibacter sp. NS-SX5 TaxID=3463854 RepID=UPI00405A368C
MNKIILSAGVWFLLSSCTTTQSAVNTGSKPSTSYETVKVETKTEAEKQAENGDFQKIKNAFEVADLDMAVFKKEDLQAKIKEINTYMGETGSAYLGTKGIVISFERGDMFGLADYVPSNKTQEDYKKLIKALNTYGGTVVVAGKTQFSADDVTAAEAAKRAERVAKFISKSSIDKSRILLDDMGVSFGTESNRSARVKNDDRVVEFLVVPKKA